MCDEDEESKRTHLSLRFVTDINNSKGNFFSPKPVWRRQLVVFVHPFGAWSQERKLTHIRPRTTKGLNVGLAGVNIEELEVSVHHRNLRFRTLRTLGSFEMVQCFVDCFVVEFFFPLHFLNATPSVAPVALLASHW